MNVWKIGSRWAEDGNPNNSILDVFFNTETVFLGRNHNSQINQMCNFCRHVRKNDYIGIADGIKIVAVAKVLSDPKMMEDFKFESKLFHSEIYKDFNYTFEINRNNMIGCKVKIYRLSEKEVFNYTRGVFLKMHKHSDEIINLYNFYDQL